VNTAAIENKHPTDEQNKLSDDVNTTILKLMISIKIECRLQHLFP
jgi:hypothetical protein